MKKIFKGLVYLSLIIVGIFIFSPFAFATWDDQTSGQTVAINDVSMASATVGWAVGASTGGGAGDTGLILYTEDGGETWTRQSATVPNVELNGVSAVDENTAWVVGDTNTTNGVILYTTDAGTTWTQQTDGGTVPNLNLNDVAAVDANTAWVVGDVAVGGDPGGIDATVLYTTDAGANWTEQTSSVNDVDLFGVSAVDENTAWAVGETDGTNGVIIYTTDAGTNWTQQTATVPNFNLNSVSAVDENTAFAVGVTDGTNGIILATTDAGTTWTQQTAAVPDFNLNDVSALTANVVWVVGQTDGTNGIVLKTTDGGTTWEQETTTVPDQDLNGVSAVNLANVWAVGAAGTIIKYSDTTAPIVTLNTITSPTTDTTPTFTGSATDSGSESNINAVQFRVDDETWSSATITAGRGTPDVDYEFTTAALSDGEHTVYVRATDTVGNTTAETNYASQTFIVDTGSNSDLLNTGGSFNYSLPLFLSSVISLGFYLFLNHYRFNHSFESIPLGEFPKKRRVYLIQF